MVAMNAAKWRDTSVGEQVTSSSSQPAPDSEGQAPVMDQDDLISENSDNDCSDSEEEEAEFSQEKA